MAIASILCMRAGGRWPAIQVAWGEQQFGPWLGAGHGGAGAVALAAGQVAGAPELRLEVDVGVGGTLHGTAD